MAALKFRDTVLESDYDAQVAIAPFLRNRVLRRIIQSFGNDPSGDFGKWATNPRVIEMLQKAQKMMDEGVMNEDEAEELILRMLKNPAYEHHAEFVAKTKPTARLPTDQLVQALNEHVRIGTVAFNVVAAHVTTTTTRFLTSTCLPIVAVARTPRRQCQVSCW